METKNEFTLDRVSVRLVKDAPIYSESKICSPQQAVNLVGGLLCEMDREFTCIINVKSNGIPINCSFTSVGTLNASLASPRELLKASILSNAAGVILLHNHPSGDCSPSKEDVMLTDRMQKVCGLMDIPLQDHLIVGINNREYFSFKEKGMLPNPFQLYATDVKALDWSHVAEKGARR
ncbi:MAG: JAB domain-containing protein [Roseburia sp.]|nr:JAB domain-containing protein [Roseburia sp.]